MNVPMKKANVRLFRFFDFSVKPGKHYRYRVDLVLVNPAQKVPAQYTALLPEELTDKEYLVTEWSAPTGVVSVPRDSRLLAGPIKSSRSVTVEPSATLTLVDFDVKTGAESHLQEPEVLRGQLVNYIQETVHSKAETDAADLRTGKTKGPGTSATRQNRPNRKNTATDEVIRTTRYHVEDLVLDMFGGNPLKSRDPKLTRPGSLLLLDPDGNLIVRNELDDMQDAARYKPPEPATSPSPPLNVGPRGVRQRPPPNRYNRP
jgi:hypothetical protein